MNQMIAITIDDRPAFTAWLATQPADHMAGTEHYDNPVAAWLRSMGAPDPIVLIGRPPRSPIAQVVHLPEYTGPLVRSVLPSKAATGWAEHGVEYRTPDGALVREENWCDTDIVSPTHETGHAVPVPAWIRAFRLGHEHYYTYGQAAAYLAGVEA